MVFLLVSSLLLSLERSAQAGLVLGNKSQRPSVEEMAEQNLLGRGIVQSREVQRLYAAGAFDECRRELNALVGNDNSLPPADLIFVWMLLSDGKRVEAKAALEQVAGRYPGHPHVYLTLGQIAFAERRWADAVVHFEKSATMALPTTWNSEIQTEFAATVLEGLSSVFEAQKRWKSAAGSLAAVQRLKSSETVGLRLARASFLSGDDTLAMDTLDELRQGNSSLPHPRQILLSFAISSGQRQQIDEALAIVTRELPEDPITHLLHADALLLAQEPQLALDALDRASESGGPAAEVDALRAQARLLQAKYAMAADLVNGHLKALYAAERTGKPASDNVRSRLMNLLVLALAADHFGAMTDEIASASARSPTSRLVKLAEENASKSSRDPLAVGLLAWVYDMAGRADEARILMSRSTELAGDYSPNHIFLLAYFLSGSEHTEERARAATMLDQALQNERTLFLLRAPAQLLRKKLAQ